MPFSSTISEILLSCFKVHFSKPESHARRIYFRISYRQFQLPIHNTQHNPCTNKAHWLLICYKEICTGFLVTSIIFVPSRIIRVGIEGLLDGGSPLSMLGLVGRDEIVVLGPERQNGSNTYLNKPSSVFVKQNTPSTHPRALVPVIIYGIIGIRSAVVLVTKSLAQLCQAVRDTFASKTFA